MVAITQIENPCVGVAFELEVCRQADSFTDRNAPEHLILPIVARECDALVETRSRLVGRDIMVDMKSEVFSQWKFVVQVFPGNADRFVKFGEFAIPLPILLLADERGAGSREVLDQVHAVELCCCPQYLLKFSAETCPLFVVDGQCRDHLLLV